MGFFGGAQPQQFGSDSWSGETNPPCNFEAKIAAPGLVGQWRHVAPTFDAATGEMRLYVDGRFAASAHSSPLYDRR